MAKVENGCGNIIDGDGTVQGSIAGSVDAGAEFSIEKSIHEARSSEIVHSKPDASMVLPTQFTIFFGGNVSVFEGIPADKVQEILRIAAAAAAKATETKTSTNIGHVPSAVLNRSPSFSSTSTGASPAVQSFPIPCRSVADLPIARRHSLQRFLEKRRDRLVNRNPYPASDIKKTGNATIKEEYPTA